MMKIDALHPQYTKYQSDWKRCRDAAEGQSAIHGAGEKYLPRLNGQSTEDYKAYRDRALFFGATGRTIEGLSGMVFRKPVDIDAQGIADDILDDIDMLDNDVESFAKELVHEILTPGRAGLLVDYPMVDTSVLSIAEARRLNSRPFIKMYQAESIINWHSTRKNNRKVLSHVYLSETVTEPVNEYEFESIEQVRVLVLIDDVYNQVIFRKNDKKEWIEHDRVVPLMNGRPMDYIPFIFVGAMGTQSAVSKPPLMDLVNVNLSHYKTTADLEHGAHFTGLPTAVITGFHNEENQEFKIGSSSAWVFSNPETTAFYLEFEGKGLETLQELLKSKESMMAALGAQMLTPDSRRNEAAETAALRHGGEHATLGSISISVTDALNKALAIMADWLGVTPSVVQLNRDFMPVKIDPQMMQQLFMALQGGRISHRTYFQNLKEGEVIASDKEFEDEVAEIQTETPSFAEVE